MSAERLAFLLERLTAQTITAGEKEELLGLIQSGQHDEQLNEAVLKILEDESVQFPETLDADSSRAILASILAADRKAVPVRSIFHRWRWVAAACVFVLLTGAGWLLSRRHNEQAPVQTASTIEPGKQGAILVLAGGKRVVLDSLGNGTIAQQSGADVVLQNGTLRYTNGKDDEEVSFNTVETPKGRQFQLVLPDGSHVWLNAASTITYPVLFTGKERRVTVQGEAYFEVAKNAAMPFVVSVADKVTVDVLGTSFNVHAYADEPGIQTTLLDGSVRVGLGTDAKILRPGEQATTNDKHLKVVQGADLDKVMAWKNGLFNFDGLGVKEVMRQLERWYNIEVVYEGPVPDEHFFGEISNQMTLNHLLETLTITGVHFRLQGERTLIVTK